MYDKGKSVKNSSAGEVPDNFLDWAKGVEWGGITNFKFFKSK